MNNDKYIQQYLKQLSYSTPLEKDFIKQHLSVKFYKKGDVKTDIVRNLENHKNKDFLVNTKLGYPKFG